MIESPPYSVVVEHPGGPREVRARNVTLETAQAIQETLRNKFPYARVVIEPKPPGMSDTWRPGGDTWEGPPVKK